MAPLIGGVEGDAIALIGMSSRFPQEADTNEAFWKFLMEARNAMTPFPDDRVHHDAYYHPDSEHAGTFHIKGAHFIAGDLAFFDSGFFSLTKTEVMTMDPQQRIVLENVYHALENAGITLNTAMSSMTSVFVSGFNHEWMQLLCHDPELTAKYKPTGSINTILSNRVSWFYDFKAASVTIDTACSSSLVAFHLGCQSLSAGECEMSVVTGVNVLMWPNDTVAMSHQGFLSPDGQCHSFDHRANGYARGEGVGTVVLKRLSDAVRDGNTIRAVVRGSGVNQDGRTAGISLPNGAAQVELIKSVYARAGLDPRDTTLIEAHGTGTAAGDPIEVRAIVQAFKCVSRQTPFYVAATKPAIGHVEGASGVASVIKSIMMLESGVIPPIANLQKVHPKIPAEKWNLRFPITPTAWPEPGKRRVSINAFGFGGTNAHVILDDAYTFMESCGIQGIHRTLRGVPSESDVQQMCAILHSGMEQKPVRGGVLSNPNGQTESNLAHGNGGNHLSGEVNRTKMYGANAVAARDTDNQRRLFLLSAFDENGLARNAKLQAAHLRRLPPMEGNDEPRYLADLAHTLCNSRSTFAWRSFCTASTLNELIDKLDSGLSKPLRATKSLALGFVFTGQGAQWYAMGRELLIYPVFKQSLEAADEFMRSLRSPWSLTEELLRDKRSSKINEPAIAQPACTALQVAIVDLLASWNIFPTRVVGHSSGEIAAAYCSGNISRKAAWKIAYFRGYVSSTEHRKKGAMMAVGLSASDLAPYLAKAHSTIPGELVIACYNSPTNNTVSGNREKVEVLKALLDADSVFARKLAISTAYHSSHMEEVAAEYLNLIGEVSEADKLQPPNDVYMFSSVMGDLVGSECLESAEYWVENLTSPVSFTKSLTAACYQSLSKGQRSVSMDNQSENVFLNTVIEIGPHSALQTTIQETIKSYNSLASIGYWPVLNRNSPGVGTILTSVGSLHSAGCAVDIRAANESPGFFRPEMLVHLPPYSFDHSTKIWYESRLSHNLRTRKHANHDLFGVPVVDWNSEEPRWRYTIRLSENPWLRDHVITGNVIYPGVGYLVMAIETAKQIVDPDVTITGYRLRDISIKRALNLPDTKDGVEVAIYMSRMDESSLKPSNTWSKFRIMSFSTVSDDWIEHCTGYISVEFATKPNPIDNGLEDVEEARQWQQSINSAFETCDVPFDMARAYEGLYNIGYAFGPLFKNLCDVKVADGSGQATGTVIVPDVASSMPKNFMREHVIHPCTIDSMLHLYLISILAECGTETLPTPMLPTFMREVWVSAEIDSTPGYAFHGLGKMTPIAAHKYECNLLIWDGQNQEGKVLVNGLISSPLSITELGDMKASSLCHTVEWKPDIDLLQVSQIPGVALSSPEDIQCRRKELQNLQLATMLMITDALEDLNGVPAESFEGHFQKYYLWLQQQVRLLEADSLPHLPLSTWKKYKSDSEFKETFYGEVAKSGPEGALAVRMASNIAQVLRKEVDPLYLMFGMDDLLDQTYSEMANTGDLHNLTEGFLEMLGHSRRDLNILEIGAGTGGSTAAFLQNLSRLSAHEQSAGKVSKIAKYTFTDISAAFFEKAKDRFRNWRHLLEFQTLNIAEHPKHQGFFKAEYDVIVAGNVLHATGNLSETLKNVRYLLKPGGRLIMHEGIRHDFLSMPTAFGQLEGWWLSVEDIRQWSPWLSEVQWDRFLKEASFSGIEFSLKDRPDPNVHGISLLVSSAVGGELYKSRISNEIVIVTGSQAQETLAFSLIDKLASRYGIQSCHVIKYHELANRDLSSALCISLVELECSVFAAPVEDDFYSLRHLFSSCEGLLWVTGDLTSRPELNMVAGVIRSVRWERDLEDTNLVTLAIAEEGHPQDAALQPILSVFEHQYIKASEDKENAEYLYQGGVIYSNRLVDAVEMNDYLTAKVSKPITQMVPLGKAEAERPLRLTTATPGMLNKLQFDTDPAWYKPLGERDIEISVQAVGLNFRDIMIGMGEHDAVTFGSEGAGIITRIGPGVTKFTVGDRVLYMDGMRRTGSFQTYGRLVEDLAEVIPESMSFEVAAALPTIYVTTIYGLYDLASLTKGETILIHSAAGGVGQAAIMLANLVGAEVFATVSTPEKAELIATKYGVQEDHIFSSRDLSFARGVMRMTNNRGVDVVLNSLAGEFLRRSWDCIAPFGRFIEIGKTDAQNNGRVSLRPFLRSATMTSVELPTMLRHRLSAAVELLARVIRLYTEGKIKEPSPMKVFEYSRLEEAFRLLQSGKGMGKIVLVRNDHDLVPVLSKPLKPLKLKEDASYVLSGGLGGIGRSIALWMASRGAKNIIFLSRSGEASPMAAETKQKLEARGVTVHVFACDVSDKSHLSFVLEKCQANLPPIRGCIQGAMVLADKIFENMSYEKFRAATRPKIQGSWNLHECLPEDMDFFILLSSVTGLVGNRGQANYAAGNTFQDALAAHRVSLGLPATSLDLGTILSTGYVADNRERLSNVQHIASLLGSVREEEIHSMVEYHLEPSATAKRHTQIASALTTAAQYMSRGMPTPSWMHTPLFTQLASASSAPGAALEDEENDTGMNMALQLNSVTTLANATAIVAEAICAKLSKLLSIAVENIDRNNSVSSNGVDSLVAVEFRTWLGKVLSAEVPLLDIMSSMPIAGTGGLSTKVAMASKLVPDELKVENTESS